MKQQKGSATIIALCVIAGIILLAGGTVVASYISAANLGNRMEVALKATYDNNQNVMAQYGQKVMEAAQVPTMMRDDISKVTKEALLGRYGDKGSQAVFQAISEKNPQIDPAVYRQLQQIIEGGRSEFQNAQSRMIDQKRVYSEALGSVWTGLWLRIAGYPKVNLADFKVTTTDRAENVFKTGKEDSPLQLRPATK